jgi:hypothetical protein
MALVSTISMSPALGAPTTITAYQSQFAVNVKGAYQPSQWGDTPIISEPTSGMTFAVKQNGTGWLFLMMWKQSSSSLYCSDQYCFGGIELGHLNNSQPMGSPTTPTMMILGSTSFSSGVDEFIATGEATPVSVESEGYATQSVCGLALAGGTYTAQCYRPFKLSNASPYDFPTLGVGSTIELGFAVGEFSDPGLHAATDMSTYVLTFSGQTYTASSTSSTSSSSSSQSSSSSSSSSSSTTSSSSSTTSTSSSTSSSSSAQSSSTSTTSSSYGMSVTTNSSAYVGTHNGSISGQVTGGASGGTVTLSITNPSGDLVFSDAVSLSSGGSFNDTFHPGVNSLWASGSYAVKASWSTLSATSAFSYTSGASLTTTTSGTGTASSSSTASVATVTVTSGGPSAATYAEELLVIVLGFSVLALAVVLRYRRS